MVSINPGTIESKYPNLASAAADIGLKLKQKGEYELVEDMLRRSNRQ